MQWSQNTVSDVMRALQTSQRGLSQESAEARKKEFGTNNMARKKGRKVLRIFLEQFFSPLMVVLFVATSMSLFLGEWANAAVIFVALFINGLLGFVEEYRADKSLQALLAYIPLTAQVRRDGVVSEVLAQEVVPGDIVLLRAGDKIVADARVLTANQLATNEAALTGESMTVTKQAQPIAAEAPLADQTNMVFAGTVVAEGFGEVIVVATGAKTQLGAISELVAETGERKTPLQAEIARLARSITVLVIVACVLFVGDGIIRGYTFAELFTISIAIAVSVIPEGLAIATTAILALGMRRLLKEQVLVRRLVAAETLGSVSVICVDKTGTLTTGDMHVRELLTTPHDRFGEDVIRAGLQTSLTYSGLEHGSTPTESAILNYLNAHAAPEVVRDQFEPFNSTNKFSKSVFTYGGKQYEAFLGAPESLLPQCDMTDEVSSWAHEVLHMHVENGRRVLALSMQIDGSLLLAALIVIEDPLRSDVGQALEDARRAGLRVVMITGDHPKTALSIARELGIAKEEYQVLTGAELDLLSDVVLSQRVHDVQVFARVKPEHKLRIVRALQAEGLVVAMMGDGVNDAPALKAADIGISVGSGTEVAKEASDMVLLDQSFHHITDAIFEGRVMFENIRKVVLFFLVMNVTELGIVAGALFVGLPIPFTPIQLLWINLVTDALPAFSLGFEAGESAVRKEGPRNPKEPLLGFWWYVTLVVMGIVNTAFLVALYARDLRNGIPFEVARTTLFMTEAGVALFVLFSVRVLRKSVIRVNPFANRTAVLAIVFSLGLLFLPYITPQTRTLFALSPINTVSWFQVIPAVIVSILIFDAFKCYLMREPKIRV